MMTVTPRATCRTSLFLFLLCSLWSLAEASIVPISSWQELKPFFANLEAGTLVVVDVDWTLLMPSDRVLQPNIRPSEGDLKAIAERNIGRCWNVNTNSRMLLKRSVRLVDDQIPALLRQVWKKGGHAVALTAMSTGSHGYIPSLERWRYKELYRLGIDFSILTPLNAEITFSNLAPKGPYPALHRGILFSAGLPKGPLLAAFLDRVEWQYQWRPQAVVFIDDHLPFLASVAASMAERALPFYGFHLRHPAQQMSLKEAQMSLQQLIYMLKNGKWLSDAEIEMQSAK